MVKAKAKAKPKAAIHTRVARSAKANPVTTTGSIGVVVALVGRYLGWSDSLQLSVTSLFLAAVPVVRGIVYWWQNRQGAA